MHPDAPARRITTWLAIFGYALVASGLPLPIGGGVASAGRVSSAARRLSAKDRSRPFPCMDKPCGCDTADRCFTNCCCHTPAETLAWARAHGVEPGVLAALERRVSGGTQSVPRESDLAGMSAPTKKSSCCSTAVSRAEPACCTTSPAPTSPAPTGVQSVAGPDSVCDRSDVQPASAAACSTAGAAGPEAADAPEPPAADDPSPQPRSRSVTLRAMLACGGIVAEWFMAGAALPPPRVEVSLVMLPVDETIVADALRAGLRAAPAAPPPRAA